jgi:hypothetical protein
MKRLNRVAVVIVLAAGTAARQLPLEIAYAQAATALSVRVGADDLVSTALPARPLVEPHVATNPRDPNHLVGGAIVSVLERADLMQGRCVAVASFDGAHNWVAHEFNIPRCYDPWLTILDDGTAIFVALETNNAGQAPHLWLFRSIDGGRTWPAEGHSFGRSHDHPTMIVDRTSGKFRGALYIASIRVMRDVLGRTRSKVFVARSTDGGRTFPQITEHEVSNMNTVTMTAALLPDGALLLPVTVIQRMVADDRAAVSLRMPHYWVVRSDDGGAHFGPPMMISDSCAGRAGFPSMAVDVSDGPRQGRAYALCHDGLRSGPYVMRSDDGGDRWSDPLHIPKTPPVDEMGQRQTSSIAVNRDGIVAVSWHDRGPEVTSRCWNVVIAFSGDGGETFTDAYKVSTKPSCPGAGANGYAAEFFSFGGHYSGLAAAADGTFRLFWSDSRGERYELRTAQVRVTR